MERRSLLLLRRSTGSVDGDLRPRVWFERERKRLGSVTVFWARRALEAAWRLLRMRDGSSMDGIILMLRGCACGCGSAGIGIGCSWVGGDGSDGADTGGAGDAGAGDAGTGDAGAIGAGDACAGDADAVAVAVVVGTVSALSTFSLSFPFCGNFDR